MEENIKYYPLTHPQMGIWYTEKMYPGTSIGNIAATLKIVGPINYKNLETVINQIIKNNDTLRLRFIEINGEPYQYISNYEYKRIDYFDFSISGIESMYVWDTIQTQTPFDLYNTDLCYFAILKINDNEFGVFNKLHHLISDGWSIVTIGNRILENYSMLKNNNAIGTGAQPSYIDYILSEQEYIKSEKFVKDSIYWNEKFFTIPEPSLLKPSKTDFINTKAKRKTVVVPSRLTSPIRKYCSDNKTSFFTLFLSALAIYVNRITSKDDLVIATPVLNRSNIKEKNTLGMFVTTVPVRIYIDPELDFSSFVHSISKAWISTLKHQKYPFDILLKEIRERQKGIDRLFNLLVSYQNAKFIKNQHSESHEGRWHFCGHQSESLYIHINDREDEGNLVIDYDYQTQIFSAKEIEYIHKHLLTLIINAIADDSQKICKLDLMDDEEKNRILYQFNSTNTDTALKKVIHEIIEEQSAKSPNDIAVLFSDMTLTYGEMNRKVNQLARTLRNKGVKPDSIVALMLKRSTDMIIGILAILKAGGAYLPLDPELPQNRIQYMIDDSNASLLVSQLGIAEKFSFKGEYIDITDENSFDSNAENLNIVNKPSDLAYVIYTSGSTGNPKAVMIEHSSVVNFAEAVYGMLDYSIKNTVLCVTTICFDIFIFEVFPTLMFGLKLVVANEEEQKIPELMGKLIVENKITKIMTTPSRMLLLALGQKDMSCFTYIQEIILGGEPFPEKLHKKLKEITNARIYNMYGPTETTVYSTFKDLTSSKGINVGRPIINTNIYILDKYLNAVPIGVQGEICIGGLGLARGYYKNETITKEKFIANPYNSNEIIYKTGDLGRWYAQGEIECLGRIDYQVKIHGYRIELGEIENQILNCSDIKDAIVIDKTDQSERKYLCAYIVPKSKDIDIAGLKSYISQKLPSYMVPTYYIVVDSIPLNSNCKVDRRALPEPDFSSCGLSKHEPPRNGTDILLIKVWSEILNIGEFGIDDNLFDLGVDSLSIINFQTSTVLYKWNLSTQDFYHYHTIRELSDRINGITNNDEKEKKQVAIVVRQKKPFTRSIKPNVSRSEYKNILLTGATGFLGIHILDYIITNTDANIHCLVRSRAGTEGLEYFSNKIKYYFFGRHLELIGNRISLIEGDITENKLGLDFIKYNELSKKIDAVINCAANVRYYGDYDEFYKTNVIGTKEVANFCMISNLPLYHISTMGVSGNHLVRQLDKVTQFTENSFYIGQNYMDNVYIYSKFSAESILNDYINNGLVATIFRVGNLTGRYMDGHFQENSYDNGFFNMIRSIIHLGKINRMLLNKKLEFTPVDLCSKAIVELMYMNEAKGKVFHILNNKKMSIRNFISCLSKIDITIEPVDETVFNEYIQQIASNNDTKKFLSGIINDFNENIQLLYPTSVRICSKITRNYLHKIDFEWPENDITYMRKLFNHLTSTGYLFNI